MKFSLKTLEILDNYSKINKSLYFVKGKHQMTKSDEATVFSEADIDEDIPQDFGIYNLKNFIQILSVFEDPDIKFSGTDIVVTEGDKKITFRSCPKDLIKTPKDSLSNIIKTFNATFTLTKGHIVDIVKVAPIINATVLTIKGDGEKIKAVVCNSDNSSADTFYLDIADSEEEFEIRLDIDRSSSVIKKSTPLDMFAHDYTVSVADTAVKFSSNSANIDYWYTLQDKS